LLIIAAIFADIRLRLRRQIYAFTLPLFFFRRFSLPPLFFFRRFLSFIAFDISPLLSLLIFFPYFHAFRHARFRDAVIAERHYAILPPLFSPLLIFRHAAAPR
jgi:hypothetical protein